MSQENVAVVRALFEAWNDGDMEKYETLLHPSIVVFAPPDWPEPGPFVGRDVVMTQFAWQRDTLDFDKAEVVGDLIDAADRVVVRFRWGGTGRGPDVAMEFTGVYTIRNGKNTLQEFFWDHAEALQTLGLSEQDGPTDS
jgi:ketosteroid isomerase-like protein